MVDPKVWPFPYDKSKSWPYNNEFKHWVSSSLNPPEMTDGEKADASALREANHIFPCAIVKFVQCSMFVGNIEFI